MRIAQFISEQELNKEFINFGFHLYAGDKNWLPPDKESMMTTLFANSKLNVDNHIKALFYDGAVRKGRALLYIAKAGLGYIGFLEFAEDLQFFQGMMDFCRKWFSARGVKKIWAPIDIDTWHRYRLLTGGFDQGVFSGEPYNKKYYPAYFKACGFEILERYYSKKICDPGAVLARLKPKHDQAVKAGYKIRSLKTGDYEREIKTLYRLSMEIFRDNFAFDGIDEEEFKNIYAGLKKVIDPGLILFALDRQGRETGFLLAYPEVKFLLAKQTLLLKFCKYMLYKAGLWPRDVLNMKTIGVLAEHRAAGLGAALLYQAYLYGIKKGYRTFNHCLIREGNISGGFDAGLGLKNKEYHLYELKF